MHFITFEGCDGSGKTTQIKLLSNYLKDIRIDCVTTKEPGGTPLAEKIRTLLLTSEIEDSATEFALLSAARRDHLLTLIQPALERKITVICDRFLDSSLVYQGIKKGLDINLMINIHQKLISELEPSITFLLDIEPENIAKRFENNSRELNHYDLKPLSFHKSIREGFLLLAKKFPNRIIIINANQDIDHVTKEIQNKISQFLLTEPKNNS